MSVEPVRLNKFYLPIYDWLNFVKFEEVPKEESYNHGVLLCYTGKKSQTYFFASMKSLGIIDLRLIGIM